MKYFYRLFLGAIIFCILSNGKLCAQTPLLRYVAIGDSYTIGTGINPQQAWPIRVTSQLQFAGININLEANLAKKGWTSEDVIMHQVPLMRPLKPSFVTVLVGANDVFQGVDEAKFAKQFKSLLERLQRIVPDPKNILVLTIPDFSVTPYAKNLENASKFQASIINFNTIISKEAESRGLVVVDLFTVSQEMGRDQALVAADGLHPSPREHVIWGKMIFKAAQELLSAK